jgi:DNA-binding transcriptional MerR regulator
MPTAEIPNRSLFKAPEVCEIAQLQPYVLRSWEAEFPDLGVTRAGSAGRVYRRHDVERVLRLKHLLFVEGLTLAGARRRMEEEATPLPPLEEDEVQAPPAAPTRAVQTQRAAADAALRGQLMSVQDGLRSLLTLLEKGRSGNQPQPPFQLRAEPARPRPAAKKARATTGRAAKSSHHGRRAR